MVLTWACLDILPALAFIALCVLGGVSIREAIGRLVFSKELHAAIWVPSATAAGIILSQYIGEPVGPRGGLAAGYAFLAAFYAFVGYFALVVAVSSYGALTSAYATTTLLIAQSRNTAASAPGGTERVHHLMARPRPYAA